MNLAGIILAAGESRRMGTPKALLELEGRTFLEVIYHRMRRAGIPRVLAVVGAGRERIQEQVRTAGLEWVVNEDYGRGQLSSLWCALGVVGDADGAMMTLVDHPLVRAETYTRLIENFKKDPERIVVPTVRDKRGHPIVFGSLHFGTFLEAPLDVGARWVLTGGRAGVREVEVGDPGIRADIDTPEQYGRLGGGSGAR